MGNPQIIALKKQLEDMKKMTPSGFTDAQQAASYFAEKEVLLESIVKGLESIESATTTENEGIKEAIKSFRDTLKNQMSHPEELTRKEVMYQLGKALAAAWTGDTQTLGSLRCTPNLKSENWNNPADFEWTREKGFQINRNKAVLGEPMGNMATNDQFLINPIYEEVIMSDVAKKSVMMNLVTNRPMAGPSIFIPERDNGGLVLNWLTSYGQQIQASKPNAPVRKELKAYTLAGYIPWFDEFEEDSYTDLGRIFMEEFTETYGQEFDKQCLIANAAPFTGAFHAENIGSHVIKGATIDKLTYIDFRDAELKVKPEERKDCCWFFNETILNHITNVLDANGNPIWRRPEDKKPGKVDGYTYYESSLLPQYNDILTNTSFAVFMNPKRILHGNRKGIEIKRFEGTTESLEYGEIFMRFRKRSGFRVSRAKNNMVLLKTA